MTSRTTARIDGADGSAGHGRDRAAEQRDFEAFAAANARFHLEIVRMAGNDMLERAVQGLPPNLEAGRFFEPEEPFATCAPLAGAQRAADRRLIALCSGLTDAQLDGPVQVPRRDGILVDRIGRILAHLFQHQIHHRGQAHAMLAGTPVPPPQLDEFFLAYDRHPSTAAFL